MKKQHFCLCLIISLLSKVLALASPVDYLYPIAKGIKHFPKKESFDDKEKRVKKIKARLERFMSMKADTPRLFLRAANLGCNIIARVDKKVLYFDECFYDSCAQQWKNDLFRFESAIASIVAHELAHYKNNLNCSMIAKPCPDPLIRQRIEHEADITATWYTSLAGYEIDLMPQTYKLMYTTSKAESNKCYPALDERIASIKRVIDTIGGLKKVFWEAKMLYLFEQYKEAENRFATIAKVVKDQEVLYNQAVSLIQWTLNDMRQLPDSSNWSYLAYFDYPLEINAYSRVSKRRRGTEDVAEKVSKDRLQKAVHLLVDENCDKHDASWHLTLATAYLLLQEISKGLKVLDNAKLVEHYHLSGAAILRGLLAYRNKEFDMSKRIVAPLKNSTFCRDQFNACLFEELSDLNESVVESCRKKISCKNTDAKKKTCPLISSEPNKDIIRVTIDSKRYSYSKTVSFCGITLRKDFYDNGNLPKEWQHYDNLIMTRERTVAYFYYREAQLVIEATATGNDRRKYQITSWYILGQ